jgi:selenide,water dikinase
LASVLDRLKRPEDPRLLVGINTADDAGVYLLQDGLALVQTVDLLTPIVEDPYVFGRIAAANSLSDVYAMGGTPVVVLNVVGFPAPSPKEWLAGILQGGQDTCNEAGAAVAGGHTFNEKEIKYGLAVTGRIDPDRIVTNAGAKPGDLLVLTKPIGCGVFAQAVLTQEEVDPELHAAATESMTTLNRAAAEAMLACEASAATDITGYGLLGHAQEMAQGSGVCIRFVLADIPLFPKARELSAQGIVDAGVAMNQSAFEKLVKWDSDIAEPDRNLLWESESSGGLLVALPERCVRQYQQMAEDKGIKAPVIGEVVAGEPGTVEVRR